MYRLLLYLFPDVAAVILPRRGGSTMILSRQGALFANGKNILNMSVVAVIGLKITPSEEKMHCGDKKTFIYFADSFLFPTFALPYRGNMLL